MISNDDENVFCLIVKQLNSLILKAGIIFYNVSSNLMKSYMTKHTELTQISKITE